MKIRKSTLLLAASLLALASAALADTVPGQGGAPGAQGSAGPAGPTEKPGELPRCDVPLNTIALVEEQNPALAQHGLTSPIPVLRLMIQQSNCFTVVDRGQALTRIQQENELTGNRSKLQRAKYFLTPNILFQDRNSGGAGLGGILGRLPGGSILGGADAKQSAAQVLLTVTDTDTGVQVFAAEGSAKTTDISFSIGGAGTHGYGDIGVYESTDIGKTVTAALLDSYVKVVHHVRQLPN